MKKLALMALGCCLPVLAALMVSLSVRLVLFTTPPGSPAANTPAPIAAGILAEPEERPSACPTCHGSGVVPLRTPDARDPRGFSIAQYVPCPDCPQRGVSALAP